MKDLFFGFLSSRRETFVVGFQLDTSPPLFYILEHYWIRWFGPSDDDGIRCQYPALLSIRQDRSRSEPSLVCIAPNPRTRVRSFCAPKPAACVRCLSTVARTCPSERTSPTAWDVVRTRAFRKYRLVASLDRKRLGTKLPPKMSWTRGVSDKTSCASGAPPSMKIGFSGLVRGDGSVCGTSNVGWRLLGGRETSVRT